MNTLTSSQVYSEGSSIAGALSAHAMDVIMYMIAALLIGILVWLANREIKTSRNSTRKSEQLLESERTSLEQRIAERTRALVQSEERRLTELDRTARFGALSQGLFHDLMSPLSSLTLYAEEMAKRNNVSGTGREMIDRMLSTSRRLGSYMDSVRRCLETERTEQIQKSDLIHEIGIVQDILAYKARMAGVEIIFAKNNQPILLTVHPVRLHQLLLNLTMNGIDACVEANAADPSRISTVTISINKSADGVNISVQDTGVGISPENRKKLFHEQFSTKKQGTGIGLMTIKSVIEQDLMGTIEVESEVGRGTRFVIDIPIENKDKK